MSNLTQYKTLSHSREEVLKVIEFLTAQGHAPVDSVLSPSKHSDEIRAEWIAQKNRLLAEIDEARFGASMVSPLDLSRKIERTHITILLNMGYGGDFEEARENCQKQVDKFFTDLRHWYDVAKKLSDEADEIQDHLTEVVEWTFSSDLDHKALSHLLRNHREDIEDIRMSLMPIEEYAGENGDNPYY